MTTADGSEHGRIGVVPQQDGTLSGAGARNAVVAPDTVPDGVPCG